MTEINPVMLNEYSAIDSTADFQGQIDATDAIKASVSHSLLRHLDDASKAHGVQSTTGKGAPNAPQNPPSDKPPASSGSHHKVMGMEMDSKQYKEYLQNNFKVLEQQNQTDQQAMEDANNFMVKSINGET